MLPVIRRRGFSFLDRMAQAMNKKQRLIANLLNDKVNRLNKQFIYLCLAAYCLFFSAAYLFIAINASDAKADFLRVEPIRTNKRINEFELHPKQPHATDSL